MESDAHSLACPQSSLLSLMDRLSELPESILLHILTFLDMKDVVKTAILSKRWRDLWTIVPTLDFVNDELDPYQDFADFVNRTLLCRGNSKIRRLRIGFFLNDSSRKDYDGWILYAAKNNVEELFLEFNQNCCYWFPPQCVYHNSSLKTLSLRSCKFTHDVQITWNSLTKLTLSFTVLGDQDVHKIMAGAPKLEVFTLGWCWGYNDLNFDSPSLKTLILREHESLELDFGPIMRVSAPKVQSLDLSGSLYRECILMNVSSVVHATVDFRPRSGFSSGEKTLKWQQNNIMEVLRSLKHVESLTLGPQCIEALALRESRRIPPQITTHKCVTLSVPMREDDLLGTVNLLKGSPALQTLIIDMQTELYDRLTKATKYLCNSNGANYLASEAEHVGCLHHLKTVKLTKFVAQHAVFPFLEFILKNGKVLENLVIIAKRGLDENSPESLLEVAQTLLSLRRASSRAVVTLLN